MAQGRWTGPLILRFIVLLVAFALCACGGTNSATDLDANSLLKEPAGGAKNQSPVAVPGAFPLEGSAPLLAHLFDAGSFDPDGEIVKWEWNFGGPGSSGEGGWRDFTDTQGDAWITYEHPGTAVARLRVTDDSGRTDSASLKIEIRETLNAAPVALASADPLTGDAPLAVNFSAAGSYDPDGTIEIWEWDFGDGAGFEDFSSSSGSATHTYTGGGTYSAVLRITDDDGATDSVALSIEVNDPPPPSSEWVHTWGLGADDFGLGIASTAAGCYVAGYSQTAGTSPPSAILLKYDDTGSLQWVNSWGGPGNDTGWGVAATTDGGAMVGGWSALGVGGPNDFYLVRYDQSGTALWERTWGLPQNDGLSSLALDAVDTAFCVGTSEGAASSGADVALLSFSAGGALLWERSWGSIGQDYGYDIQLDGYGSIYVVGRTNSIGAGNYDVLLLKYNTAGNLLWARTWGAAGEDGGEPNFLRGMGITTDRFGNVYVAGRTNSFGSGDYDGLLLKFDASGNIQWARTWDGGGADELRDIVIDSFSRLFATGFTEDPVSGMRKALVLKVSIFGGLVSQECWTSDSSSDGRSLAVGAEDSLFLAGSAPDNSGQWDSISGSWAACNGLNSLAVIAGKVPGGTLTDVSADSEKLFVTGTEDSGGGAADVLIMRRDI